LDYCATNCDWNSFHYTMPSQQAFDRAYAKLVGLIWVVPNEDNGLGVTVYVPEDRYQFGVIGLGPGDPWHLVRFLKAQIAAPSPPAPRS
jgi:hypothetical protein